MKLLSKEELEELDKRISANADRLIAMGYDKWRKSWRRSTRTESQKDKVRRLEEQRLGKATNTT